jgi:hypothetical protein
MRKQNCAGAQPTGVHQIGLCCVFRVSRACSRGATNLAIDRLFRQLPEADGHSGGA